MVKDERHPSRTRSLRITVMFGRNALASTSPAGIKAVWGTSRSFITGSCALTPGKNTTNTTTHRHYNRYRIDLDPDITLDSQTLGSQPPLSPMCFPCGGRSNTVCTSANAGAYLISSNAVKSGLERKRGDGVSRG